MTDRGRPAVSSGHASQPPAAKIVAVQYTAVGQQGPITVAGSVTGTPPEGVRE